MLALAVAALVVVCLGLPQALVVCTQPCCGGHVKLTTACALLANAPAAPGEAAGCPCCGRRDKEGDRGPGERNTVGCRGCAHVSLGTDLGMPPADADVHADASVFERIDLLAAVQPRSDAAGCEHPPSTGPPRCDRRTALRAITVLRI